MTKIVDSYRFIRGMSKRLIKSWIRLESPREIPWTSLSKPLSDCTVALISSGRIALETDRPFDQEGERKNPWWGLYSVWCFAHPARRLSFTVMPLSEWLLTLSRILQPGSVRPNKEAEA